MRESLFREEWVWLYWGLLLSAGYLASLLGFPLVTMGTVILATALLIGHFHRATWTWVAITCVVLAANHVYGGKTLTWDVVSFELQNYDDWRHGMRGAYWDYSKLSSMYHGASAEYGRGGLATVFGFICLSLCAALSTLYDGVQPRRHGLFLLGLAFLLTKIAKSVFIVGKGDMLCAALLLLTLHNAWAMLREPDAETAPLRVFNSMQFAVLAISTKLGAVLFVMPLAAIVALAQARVLRRSWRALLAGGMLAALLLAPFMLNWWRYGALIDAQSTAVASQYTIAANLGAFARALFPRPHLIPAAIVLLAGHSAWRAWQLRHGHGWKPAALWLALVGNILFTPWAWLHGPDSMENFRLVLFPLLAMLVISHAT